MSKDNVDNISDEQLAAFLDGNTNAKETMRILSALKSDPLLQETVMTSARVDTMLGNDDDLSTVLPMERMAAQEKNNLCDFEVGTTTYNGSADVANNIYLPNQSLNSTDSPTFNTVTAALNGNATSADKVNNAITITSTTGYTTPSTIVYDGSEAKTATIYTPDQEVNKTSSPTFNTVTAALNGNATSADKVNNVLTLNVGGTTTSYDGSTAKTVTIGSNAKLTVATTDTYTAASTTEYDGSTAKTATIYTPDQEVNKTSSPTFANP